MSEQTSTIKNKITKLADAVEPEEPPQVENPLLWKPYPVEVFPKPVRQFIERGAEAMQVDPVFFALPVLVTTAAAIGNTRRLQVKEGWDIPAILWTAIMGRTGTVKSSPLKKVIKPTLQHQDREFDRFESERAKYDNSETNEQPTPTERFIVSDITIEALAAQLQYSPRGVLVYTDELAGWVRSFGAYKGGIGGDMQAWLSLYDGDNLIVDRKTGDKKTIHISHAAACVLGGIQPSTLQRNFTEEHFETGLAARILLVWPPEKKKRWTDKELTAAIENEWADVMAKLFDMQAVQDAIPGKLSPAIISLCPAALGLFKEFYDRHNEEMEGVSDEGERAFFAKLEGGAARMALVIHSLRLACGEIPPEQALTMDANSMQAGISLADWHKNESRRICRRLYGEKHLQDRQSLLGWLQSQGSQTTPRELRNARKGRYPLKVDAELALDELVQDGVGTWETYQNPKGGPPSKVFHMNSGGA